MGSPAITLNPDASINPTSSTNPLISIFSNSAFNTLPIKTQAEFLHKKFPNAGFDNYKDDPKGYYEFRKSTRYPLDPSMDPAAQASTKDKILNVARPILDGIATGGTGVAAAPLGPLAAGAASLGAGTLMDGTIQNAYDNPEIRDKGTSGKLAAGLMYSGENEIGGKVMDGLFRGAKAAFSNPGTNSIVDAMMQQYYQKKFGSNVSPWIRAMLPLIPGKKNIAPNINDIADSIKNDLGSQLSKSQIASNNMAQTAKMVAANNSIEIPSNVAPDQYVNPGITRQVPGPPIQKQSSIVGPNGQPTMTTAPGPPITLRRVDGPINLSSTTQVLQNYLGDIQKTFGDPTKNITAPHPADTPIVTAAKNLLNLTENGTKPISFEDAWNFKQALTSQYNKNSSVKPIYQALNNDIEGSMQKWPNDPNKIGLKAWQDSKATVEQRLQHFDDGKQGVNTLLDNDNAPNSGIDNILNDRVKLGRALSAGDLTLPDGTHLGSNVKANLRGYAMGQLLKDPGSAASKLADPVMQDSYKQLFTPAEMSNISKFGNRISGSDVTNNSRLGYMTPGGIALGSALLLPHMGVSPWEAAAGGITAGRLGWTATNRVLANPTTSRIVSAAMTGQPLGMSTTLASRLLMDSLRGATIYLKDQNGNEHPQKIGDQN